MCERPILFSTPMVRAILDGRKTQTRRVVKPRPDVVTDDGVPARFTPLDAQLGRLGEVIRCPYGQPGDRLWVREGFKPIASGEVKDGYGEVRYGYAYRADSAAIWAAHPTVIHDLTGQPATGPMQFQERPWKSPIHMPKRASRITLEVTGVRVDRLQAISEADAVAEGVERPSTGIAICDAKTWYRVLWEQINGAGSWDANPWVWVVEFRRVQP